MGTAYRSPDIIKPYVCSTSSVAEGALMVQDGSVDDGVKTSSTSTPTLTQETFKGLAYTVYTATSPTMPNLEVVTSGVWPGIAGGGITRGNPVTSNGDGTLIAASPAGGTNVWIIGFAQETAVTGQRFAVDIRPQVIQG